MLVCILLLSVNRTNAQDIIHKKNGEVIEAKVISVSPSLVTFKKFDNLSGPEYSIEKSEVKKIGYSNGSFDIFEPGGDKIGVNINGKPFGKEQAIEVSALAAE